MSGWTMHACWLSACSMPHLHATCSMPCVRCHDSHLHESHPHLHESHPHLHATCSMPCVRCHDSHLHDSHPHLHATCSMPCVRCHASNATCNYLVDATYNHLIWHVHTRCNHRRRHPSDVIREGYLEDVGRGMYWRLHLTWDATCIDDTWLVDAASAHVFRCISTCIHASISRCIHACNHWTWHIDSRCNDVRCHLSGTCDVTTCHAACHVTHLSRTCHVRTCDAACSYMSNHLATYVHSNDLCAL